MGSIIDEVLDSKPKNAVDKPGGAETEEIMKGVNKPDRVPLQSSSSLIAAIPSSSSTTSLTNSNNDNAATTSSSATKNSSNAIQVNPNQRGNPLLKAITCIPWEFNDEIIPDYVVGAHACVLFLSIRYHNLKPDYLHERLKKLGKNYQLRVLLVHVDIKEPHNALKHLTRICLLADLTLMLAFSPEEAGKIIETYKLYENASAEKIQEKPESDSHLKIVNALTSIRTVNKTDAATLLVNFGTLANLIEANENKLSSCIGLGPRKQQKLLKIFNEPFLKK